MENGRLQDNLSERSQGYRQAVGELPHSARRPAPASLEQVPNAFPDADRHLRVVHGVNVDPLHAVLDQVPALRGSGK